MTVGLVALLSTLAGVFTGSAVSASAYSLPGVACPSASQCTAVDSRGLEVTFNPIAPGTPTPAAIDGTEYLRAVACPSVSQCTAVGGDGREVTFDPAVLGSHTPTTIDSASRPWAVACPSVSQCTAVDGKGREVTFNPAAPGIPTPTTIDSSEPVAVPCSVLLPCTAVYHGLVAVACPSVFQCTAVDQDGWEVTFDPTAPGAPIGAVVDQPSFCGSHCPQGAVTGVACPSVSQCTAVDDAGREVTFDPTAPGKPTRIYVSQNTVFFGGFNAVACPSVSLCTAVDSAGREVTFNPEAPGSPTPAPIDAGVVLHDVACPSAAQCTAVDESGAEITFNPGAPGSAMRTMIDGDQSSITTTTTTASSGIAMVVRGVAPVKRGVATIELTCTGMGACTGTIKLLVHLAVSKRVVHRHGRRHMVKRTRAVVIGTATFSIAAGASQVVRVHLSRQGRALMLRTGRRGLQVKIGGSGVNARLLLRRQSALCSDSNASPWSSGWAVMCGGDGGVLSAAVS